MWTMIKNTLYLFIGVLMLFIIIPVLMMVLVSPEAYKSTLTNKIQQETGRKVMIEGPLQWTFYPAIGIRASRVNIKNPPQFKSLGKDDIFISAQGITASVLLRPLLNGQLQFENLLLEGAQINLIKNNQGQVNWQIQFSPFSMRQAAVSKDAVLKPEEVKRFFRLSAVTLSGLKINNSQIVYDNEIQHKKFIFNHIYIDSKNIALNMPFPLQMSFELTAPDISQMPIKVNLTSEIKLNPDKIILQHIKANTNQYHWEGTLQSLLARKDLSALSGELYVTAKKGVFKGIDLYYYSDAALSLINKTVSSRIDTHETPFDNVQARMDIQNGLLTTPYFFITAPSVQARGTGEINLLTQVIAYHLSLQRMTNGVQIKPRGPAIPLIITGNIAHPVIRPDWKSFLFAQVKEQFSQHGLEISQKINQAVQKGLQLL